MASPTKLNLLPYLQSWDGVRLGVRLLAIPRGNPLDPLVDGQNPPGPSFATAHLVFDVRLVKGLDQMATTTSPSTSVVITPASTAQAEALFKELAKQFQIDPAPPPANPRPTNTTIRKYLPPTYRQAIGFSGARTPFVVTDDSYFCAISASPPKSYNKLPPADPMLPWGKVIAMAMRQPVLAEALGLIRPLEVTVPTADFFKGGGWLYVSLATTSDAFALTTLPDALKMYAARIPPLEASRSLFTPVLFPVASTPPPGPYDDLFLEVEEYDDGFAKAVHATQPQHLDPLREDDDGSRPVKDLGIRLGWDDEQVAIWLNRQIDPASAPLDAPMGVLGYRVDAREVGNTQWHSLCRARGPVNVGPLTVGNFNGELGVETISTQLDGQKVGTYWLPVYYTNWAGPALVTLDTLTQRLLGGPDLANPNRVQGVAPDVPLRYGKTYEFRVRLMDHTGGGPTTDKVLGEPGPQPIFTLPFKRWIRPRTASVVDQLPSVPDPAKAPTQIHIRRPLLGHPTYGFTGAPNAEADLLADLPKAKAEGREVGLPDPDVTALKIAVQVEALGFDTLPGGGTDAGHHTVYETTRPYPKKATDLLVIDLDWRDVKQTDSLAPGTTSGALPVPTARNVRLIFTPVAKEDPQLRYFGADDVRFGTPTFVDLRHHSADERGLYLPDIAGNLIKGIFLQPDQQVDAVIAQVQKAAGKGVEAPANAIGRLADVLGLMVNDVSLRGKPGRRTVFGCSPTLRHILAPDASSITFASKSDLVQHWIIAIRVTLDRDWTWDGLAPDGIAVIREGTGEVGRIESRRMVNNDALLNPQRSQTDLVYFDVVDPKPEPNHFPAELDLAYRLEPDFIAVPTQADASLKLSIHLPITTRPSQIPRLVSAGIALSPYVRSADYSSTEARHRAFWLEFDRPVDNPDDLYFVRMLRYVPDSLLLGSVNEIPEAAEPPLPIDPEPIRVIIPGQSDDGAGINAMQQLIASDSHRHFMVPLPPGLHEDSPELFGFFTYEIRVGHEKGWSTAQGRFGAALRVTGVQHPAPTFSCVAARESAGIIVSAPFANPVFDGRSLRPYPPATEIWILLYAQVVQADGADRRNVLLGRRLARSLRYNTGAFVAYVGNPDLDYGLATWSNEEITFILEALTLEQDTPISCLAVETLPGGPPLPDPLGANLGYQRLLRTSPLVPIPAIC
jgi:hypothetical protein